MKTVIAVFVLQMLAVAALACPAIQPVPVALTYHSPYDQSDPTRSRINPAAQAQMRAALAPVDTALRDLARVADRLDDPQMVACLTRHLTHWALSDGLRDLQTDQVNLTIGARLAAFALLTRRVGQATEPADLAEVAAWLNDRAKAQISFWQNEAPVRARQGNLRAWANLAVWATGDVSGDQRLRDWALAGHSDILCIVAPDGSLPIEMRRGSLSLHYQLHALGPLVTLSALTSGTELPCQHALVTAAEFALRDLETGAATEALTGVQQSYFNGQETVQSHELAWIEAYLTMTASARAEQIAHSLRPLRNSKLGGNQSEIWCD